MIGPNSGISHSPLCQPLQRNVGPAQIDAPHLEVDLAANGCAEHRPAQLRIFHHELAVADRERHAHAIELEHLAHDLAVLGGPRYRTVDGRAAVVGTAEHFRHDRVAEDAEVIDPQDAGLLGCALALEVDLEAHAAALNVGIEVDQLECLTGVG